MLLRLKFNIATNCQLGMTQFLHLILSIKCSVATQFQFGISYTKEKMPIFVKWSIFNNLLIEMFF